MIVRRHFSDPEQMLKSKGVVKNELGLYIIRGDNVSVVGRIDKELKTK